jgi:cytoskeletal protein CcmA (bactofilin family)
MARREDFNSPISEVQEGDVMAISSFSRGKGESGAAGSSPAAAATGANLTAFIDQGSEFEGKLNFKDTVRIDGTFRGEITSENTLLVGETGEIEATIHSQSVIVCGFVTGNIIAGRQVVLHKGARMDGDITTPSLVIEEGAVFNGQVSMKIEGTAKGLASVKDIRVAGKQPESKSSEKSDKQN